MICCILFAAMLGALLSLPRRLFALCTPASVDWRPDSAAALRNPNRLSSIKTAVNGLRDLIASEMNFRFHLVAAALVIAVGFWQDVTTADWRWLTLAIALVLLTEAINTAIERTCDAITLDIHPTIRVAKDIAASAVLLAAITSIVIGVLTFLPYLTSGGLCG
ncbi:MAG: diacylglycerol kinase family protein [Deltaproteobacteria bacterium]